MFKGIPLLLIAVLVANTDAFLSNRMTTSAKWRGESVIERTSSKLQLQVSKHDRY